jgi:hypothetical protein
MNVSPGEEASQLEIEGEDFDSSLLGQITGKT